MIFLLNAILNILDQESQGDIFRVSLKLQKWTLFDRFKLEKWTPGFNGFMVIFERSVVGFVGMWVPQSGIQVIVGSVVKS